jgi:hypothetical protein
VADEQDDWDASEDEKPKAAAKTVAPPPVRQKKLKDKLAEKERLAVCPIPVHVWKAQNTSETGVGARRTVIMVSRSSDSGIRSIRRQD